MAQWTPQQLLSVASHAMQSDRVEDALNVYQYLSRSFPGTQEAEFAAGEIDRLSAPAVANDLQSEPKAPPSRRPQAARPAAQQFAPNGHDQAEPMKARSRRPGRDRFPVEPVEGGERQPSSHMGNVVTREAVPYMRDYKTGILLARLISGLGWIAFALAGIAALAGGTCWALAYFSIWLPKQALLLQLIVLAPGLAAAAVGGLVQVVVGQALRALLDQANATRELLEIRRRY